LKLTKPMLLFLVFVAVLLLSVKPALCWSNNGYSDNPAQPKYGTHDWIAQHALDWLPNEEKKYITDNLPAYLYGTELPDNNQATDGIEDTVKHHIYFYANGSLQDGAAAQRASEEYQKALNYLKSKDYENAAKTVGIMSHYIADVAVFGHVMGAKTAWRAENHHSDYEDHVNDKTKTYDSNFNSYLSFDGSLTTTSASDAAKNIAYDTTFDGSGGLTCVWMDNNYNWNSQTFSNRAGESLDLAVNSVADVLHTLYSESSNTIPEFPTMQILIVAMLTVLATAIVYKKSLKKAFSQQRQRYD
jgi:hypothetical protein